MSMLFWPIAFLCLGLALLVVEVFVPSGGFIGFSALFCIGVGLWHAFDYSTWLGVVFLVIDLVAVPLTAMLAFWLWAHTPLSRKFFLKPPSGDEIDVSHPEQGGSLMIDCEGRTLTPLRPCGHVLVQGRRFDGLAEEGFIPEGAAVRVVRTRSGQLVVRTLRTPGDPGSTQSEASTSTASPPQHTAFLIEESP